MEMTLAQRAVAFVAIVFLFVLACIGLAAYAKMARPELRVTTLSDNAKEPRRCHDLQRSEYSERSINSPGCSRRIWIFDFDPRPRFSLPV